MSRSLTIPVGLVFVLPLLLFMGLAQPASATRSAAGTPYPTGQEPYAVVAGDFNGDGESDLATANAGADTVSVLFGNGSGRFTSRADYDVGAGPIGLAAGDFNGDGTQDVAVSCSVAGQIGILLSDAAVGFQRTDIAVGPGPSSVAVADFNGDGEQDLVIVDALLDRANTLLGDGAGGFAVGAELATGALPVSVAAGDIDGDGHQDIATADYVGNSCTVQFGDGAGGFSGGPVGTYVHPVAVALGDLNNDGALDLVDACCYDPATDSGRDVVGVKLWQGTLFGIGWGIVLPDTNLESLAVADLNGDGKKDLVTAGADVDKLYIYLGNGTGDVGSFRLQSVISTGSVPFSIATNHFDADAGLDLATANLEGDTVSVVLTKRMQGITSVKPSRAKVGSRVTIAGWGFGAKQGAARVFFGSKAVRGSVSWGMTKIVVKVPRLARGRKALTVKTPLGKTGVKYFTVL